MIGVSSWGRLDHADHDVRVLTDRDDVPRRLHERSQRPALPHGMGRSYGDVCLNPGGILWKTTGLDRFIRFDRTSGVLHCEAGVLLRDIQRLAIPDGWMLPVTPGTQLVTVGGAIANDVHGKNHHVVGTFGDHLLGIGLLRTDGTRIECGPHERPDWYAATVGGLGLTGLIVEARLQLRRTAGPWLDTETLVYRSLDEFFVLADASEADWEHTVSWVDCATDGGGRGVFLRANHIATPTDGAPRAAPSDRKRAVPFTPPVSLINRLTLRSLNQAYFHAKSWGAGRAVAHYEPFFYPLDNVGEWNRVYGPHGFFQYQSVVPRGAGLDATRAMLATIAKSGQGSFLAVLKTFGDRAAPGLLSFPRPGVTLALDFPNHGDRTLKLFDELDAIVRDAGGALYPAKDARMSRAMFEAGYPRIAEFLPFRDPGLASAMSRRLMDH